MEEGGREGGEEGGEREGKGEGEREERVGGGINTACYIIRLIITLF